MIEARAAGGRGQRIGLMCSRRWRWTQSVSRQACSGTQCAQGLHHSRSRLSCAWWAGRPDLLQTRARVTKCACVKKLAYVTNCAVRHLHLGSGLRLRVSAQLLTPTIPAARRLLQCPSCLGILQCHATRAPNGVFHNCVHVN